jgi:hypothetical protein
MIKKAILFLSILVASGILMTNIYTSIVDATSWGSNIPESLQTAREYFKVVNPGTFFRIFSPLNQVLALVALVLFWKSAPASRKFLAAALVMYVITDVFTFAFFYPRNDIMFVNGTDTAVMAKAWSEWNTMNWVRSLVIFTGVCCSFVGMEKVYLK